MSYVASGFSRTLGNFSRANAQCTSEVDDAGLLERARRGDADAFSQLFARYQGPILVPADYTLIGRGAPPSVQAGAQGGGGRGQRGGGAAPGAVAADWAAARGAIRVGGNVKVPVQAKRVNPAYPPAAQAARVQGVVILEAVIGADGHVRDARVLRSIPLLDQAALDAVRQWEYTPTLLNGVPVPLCRS